MQIIIKKNKLELIIPKKENDNLLTSRWEEAQLNCSALCEAFNNWLENAMPGEKFCYYRGMYVSGKKVGGLVSRAYEKGLVTMYQSKDGSQYRYWAIKTKSNGGKHQ